MISASPAVRAIIFDIGNVLLFHDNELLSRTLAGTYGLDTAAVHQWMFRSDAGGRAARGELSSDEMHRAFCREFGVDPDYAGFARAFNSHFTPNVAIEPLIRSLRGRYRLLVLSNTNPIHVEYVREHLPVLKLFDDLLLSCELGLGKPQPEIYREAVRRSGCRAEQCLFTDDVPAYVEAAKAIGMQGIVFTGTSSFVRELQRLGISENECPMR